MCPHPDLAGGEAREKKCKPVFQNRTVRPGSLRGIRSSRLAAPRRHRGPRRVVFTRFVGTAGRPGVGTWIRADPVSLGGTQPAPPARLLRKEVIQPHVPVGLPCYDFTPVTGPTFDGSLPCGLGHRLRVLPAPMV